MKFTLSVRSFHVPDTPFTSAWPPNLPSVPTSRATRVTSSANDDSWSTIVLMVFLSSRISPRASTVIFCDRSPLATAVVTWAMLRSWPVRLLAMKLTLSVRSFHVPDTPFTFASPPSLPSLPPSRPPRVTPPPTDRRWSTLPFTPVPTRPQPPLTGREADREAPFGGGSQSVEQLLQRLEVRLRAVYHRGSSGAVLSGFLTSIQGDRHVHPSVEEAPGCSCVRAVSIVERATIW